MTTLAAPSTGVSAGPYPRRSRSRPTLLDVALGVLVGCSLLWAMTLAADLDSPVQLPPVAFAAHVAVIVGSTLWRSAPRAGLLVAVLGVAGYHALSGAPVGLVWPLVLVSYGVARRGHLPLGIAVGVAYLGAMLTFRIAADGGAGSLVGLQVTIHSMAQETVLLAAALLVGEVVRSRAQLAADAEERLRLVERRHEQETERRIGDERLRIAHDLHDVAAHTVSIIALHANVAAERFDDAPDQAREAVETIRSTSERAGRELRAVVGVLRSPDAGEPPADADDAIRAAADRTRAAGLDVTLHLDVPAAALRGAPGVAASRIVQEALTNVLRHAGASSVTVHVDAIEDRLLVEVVDDGRAQTEHRPSTVDGSGGGVGLLGMRERAEALGGSVVWGPNDAGGFRVRCELPRSDEA